MHLALLSLPLQALAIFEFDRAAIYERGLFYGYHADTWLVIFIQAVGGLLTAPNDVSALADAVASLVHDADKRRQMGRAAVEHAAGFDWASSGDRMLREYVKWAGEGVPPPAA